jgi:two-component system nitrate/nitrite response regulator NarL
MNSCEGVVRIMIADDHSLFREGLRSLIEENAQFQVVGEGVDGRETLRLAKRLKPDILLLDLQMPHLSGIEVLQQLGSRVEKTRVILLAAAPEKEQVLEALRLGVRGVLLKESTTSLLFECLEAVVSGQYWIFKERVSDLSQLQSDVKPAEKSAPPRNFGLTKREMEIVSAIVAGKTNREIGQQLSISEQTVKHHVTNIFDKAGVYNRLELALFAIHHGLIGRQATADAASPVVNENRKIG